MRELVKSFSSMMLSLSLFGVKQIENMVTPKERGERSGPASRAMNSITNATLDQFGETLRSTFRTIDNVQRGLIGLVFSILQPSWGQTRSTLHRPTAKATDPCRGQAPGQSRRFRQQSDSEPVNAAEALASLDREF
jgi:hypothetical protein